MRDPEFWHNKWAANQIGFHLEDVNPLLIRVWSYLAPKRGEKCSSLCVVRVKI